MTNSNSQTNVYFCQRCSRNGCHQSKQLYDLIDRFELKNKKICTSYTEGWSTRANWDWSFFIYFESFMQNFTNCLMIYYYAASKPKLLNFVPMDSKSSPVTQTSYHYIRCDDSTCYRNIIWCFFAIYGSCGSHQLRCLNSSY